MRLIFAIVSASNALAGRSADVMADFASSVGQLSDTVEEITAPSAEQARGIEQVGLAVTEMDRVTQQNASLVEQFASASKSLLEQAAQLLQSVSFFTLASSGSENTVVVPTLGPIITVSKTLQRECSKSNWITF